MSLVFWGIAVSLLAGIAIRHAAERWPIAGYDGRKRVTTTEFWVGAGACCLLVVPVSVIAGKNIALSNNLTFNEYWNGFELAALKSVTDCYRDGPCLYEYECDPYQVTVIKTRTVSDAKGKTHTETYTDHETRYHDCPHAAQEWDFFVRTTLGDFHIERTFPDNAQPWRGGHGLPDNIRQGTPPFWEAAATRIAAGDPGPVTVRKSYKNYILASQSSILKRFSGAVERYAALLPAPSSGTRDYYLADKAYFVGVDGSPLWSDAVMRFNAAFGTELQGDLHVVLVGPGVTSNPDEFVGALNAHWTGTAFGRNALSKNGLVVVLGTDGHAVTWARAFTGMPVGNENLLVDIRNGLVGLPLDPTVVLGRPVGVVNGADVEVRLGGGALEKLVWGEHAFKRVCMTCKEEGGGGFGYLGDEIEPTVGQRRLIVLAALLLSLVVWGALLAIGFDRSEKPRHQ